MANLLLAPELVIDTSRCACGHPQSEHDAVGRRFCEATSSSELIRGCICRSAPARPSR